MAALALPATPWRTAWAAPSGAAGDRAVVVEDMVDLLMDRARRMFAVSGSAPLVAELRQQGEALARDHLQQLQPLLVRWAEEEFDVQGSADRAEAIAWALLARWSNAMALWSLYSAGVEHDRAWWAAQTAPRACNVPDGNSYLTGALDLLRHVQGADRRTLLEGLQESLGAWVTGRWPPPPARPALDLLGLAAEAVAELRHGHRTPDAAPMAPVLAASVFPAEGRRPALSGWLQHCARAQWQARQLVAAGAEPTPEQVLALRFATMLTAEQTMPPLRDTGQPPPQPHEYPLLARRSGITGTATVESEVDAAGRVQRHRVVRRDIRVPGIRDTRPVAFETLLDAPALAAAAMRKPVRPPGQAEGTPYVARTAFDYRLDD